jgi:DNA-binding NarL/FixJ family response regulator
MSAQPQPSGSVASLSPRETTVLEMTSQGLKNGEIAERLDVSVHAVKFHLASIYRKLGVANRTEAAVAYLRATP